MVVALAVTAVVLAAAQSAVMLAGRAVPDVRSPSYAAVRASAGLERLMSELSCAKTLVTASPTRVVFTVADRTGDGADDTIDYSWAGKKGDPVVRTMNGAGAEAVIASADTVALSYDTATASDAPVNVTGAETVLATYTGILGLGNQTIDDTHLAASCFTPNMPAGAVSFAVTRASLTMKSNSTPTGVNLIQIRGAANGLPTAKIYDQAVLLESALPTTQANKTVTFTGNVAIPAGSSIALAVACEANSPSGTVQTSSLSVSLAGYTYGTSSDAGITWTGTSFKQLYFTVYGTVTTQTAGAKITRCTNARCELSTPGGRATLAAGTHLINEPKAP